MMLLEKQSNGNFRNDKGIHLPIVKRSDKQNNALIQGLFKINFIQYLPNDDRRCIITVSYTHLTLPTKA